MKEQDQLKDNDHYARKIVRASGLEVPAQHFTTEVIAKIEAYERQRLRIVYKPLISKRGWVTISFGILAIYITAFSQTQSFSWFKTTWGISFDKWIDPGLQFLSQLSLSGFFMEVLIYFLLLCLLILGFLKYTVDRKLGYPGIFS